MTQTLLAKNVNIRDLIDQFGLQLVRDREFFTEWREDLPELTAAEMQTLDVVREGFFNLIQYPPYLEKPVQISILSPLLLLAGFFLHPFQIRAEQSTEIISQDEGIVIRGQLDLIVLREQFWVLVIESKGFSYSFDAGWAQLLSYMLANPNQDQPCFGLITNGESFVFLKLVNGSPPRYGMSGQFSLLNDEDIYHVLKIMKRFGQM